MIGRVGELHPHLSRVSEAHSAIDAVRAARNFSVIGAGDRWLAIGGSQPDEESTTTTTSTPVAQAADITQVSASPSFTG